ncbi:MAG: C2H2-type zinc finger protein [Betaproteobacteria bacterium]|nr:C2H2-type zinc finger protein [Betaproteobacteria bacterium]
MKAKTPPSHSRRQLDGSLAYLRAKSERERTCLGCGREFKSAHGGNLRRMK